MVGPLDEHPQLQAYRKIGVGVSDVGLGKRPAFLVVDLQLAFTEGGLASERTEDVLKATADALASARQAGMTVIFVHVVFDAEADIGSVWWSKGPHLVSCLRGRKGAEIDARITPLPDELVLEKGRASAFFGTRLDEVLRARGIDSLVVCGTSTSGCVRATVVDAAARDYPVTVIADAVDDRDARSHEATLVDIQAKYGDVISLDQWYELSRDRAEARSDGIVEVGER